MTKKEGKKNEKNGELKEKVKWKPIGSGEKKGAKSVNLQT